MARLFGTDGVRGVANTELTCELAYRLGQAAAVFLGKNIVVGKDTRLSGDMLESALAAGIMSAGGTELSVGIIPTPAVALLVRELHADGGAVISASHNPPEYNGIKLFDAEGYKLPDEVEDKIEEFIKQGGLEGAAARAEEGAEGEDAAAMFPGDEVGVALPTSSMRFRACARRASTSRVCASRSTRGTAPRRSRVLRPSAAWERRSSPSTRTSTAPTLT